MRTLEASACSSCAKSALAALLGTTGPYSGPFVDDLRVAGAGAGLRIEPVLISGPEEFESAFAEMARADAQAKPPPPDPVRHQHSAIA